jgi:endonuclease-8
VPEGPEIRIEADALRRALGGRVAQSVFFAFPRLKPYQSRLSGARVTSVRARGKAILVGFENDLVIYSHNQLYGRWRVFKNGDLPDTGRQLRLAIQGPTRSALLYSASEIEVLKREALATHPYLSRLGPDILNQRVGVRGLGARFSAPEFANRRLASLLLDQRFIAGIGNYLRSEILFAAGVHPERRPRDLKPAEVARLASVTRGLVWQSYRSRGITNDLHRAARLEAAGRTREEFRFAVFDRAGEACFVCGAPIRRQILAGRRCYFCPACQPL